MLRSLCFFGRIRLRQKEGVTRIPKSKRRRIVDRLVGAVDEEASKRAVREKHRSYSSPTRRTDVEICVEMQAVDALVEHAREEATMEEAAVVASTVVVRRVTAAETAEDHSEVKRAAAIGSMTMLIFDSMYCLLTFSVNSLLFF